MRVAATLMVGAAGVAASAGWLAARDFGDASPIRFESQRTAVVSSLENGTSTPWQEHEHG